MDGLNTNLGFLLQQTAKMFRARLSAELAPLGLTPAQAAVLLACHRLEEATHSRLSEAVDADVATTTGVLRRLERDGWLRSRPHPADRRSKLFALTEAGREAVPRLRAAMDRASLLAASALEPPEREALAALLAKLARGEAAAHGAAS